jgi:predicted ribosomally synthesized peptide with SipW-like signal peptide
MFADLPLVGNIFNPRSLAALTLLLGIVSSQGGRGTLAYFTATAASDANTFVAGKLSLSQSIASGTSTSIQWNATGITAGGQPASCALSDQDATPLNTNNAATGQPMVPGTYCVGLVTVSNTGTVDAWLRLRLHLSAVNGGAGAASGAHLALLEKLQFSLFEWTGTGAATNCATATFTPTVINAADGASVPTDYAEVVAENTGTADKIRREKLAGATSLLGTTPTAQAVTANTNVGETYAAGSFYNLIGHNDVNAIRATGASAANLDRATGTQPTRYFCAVFHWPNGGEPANNTSGDNAAVDGNVEFKFSYAIAQKSGRGA